MSWDASLKYKGMLGSHCPTCTTTPYIDIGNYTYNVSAMFKKALGYGFDKLHEKPAFEVSEELGRAIADMLGKPDKYKKLNPENGWGDYEGAVEFLEKIRRACLQHPNLHLSIY